MQWSNNKWFYNKASVKAVFVANDWFRIFGRCFFCWISLSTQKKLKAFAWQWWQCTPSWASLVRPMLAMASELLPICGFIVRQAHHRHRTRISICRPFACTRSSLCMHVLKVSRFQDWKSQRTFYSNWLKFLSQINRKTNSNSSQSWACSCTGRIGTAALQCPQTHFENQMSLWRTFFNHDFNADSLWGREKHCVSCVLPWLSNVANDREANGEGNKMQFLKHWEFQI